MVKIITKENVHKFAHAAYLIYRFQELFTHIVEVNNPKLYPCVYAMWHAHQCCVHGIEDKSNLNVLISRSKDGDIVAYICEHWGFRVIRGSAGKKGGTTSMMQMISELKEKSKFYQLIINKNSIYSMFCLKQVLNSFDVKYFLLRSGKNQEIFLDTNNKNLLENKVKELKKYNISTQVQEIWL